MRRSRGWRATVLAGALAGTLGACGGGANGTSPTPVATPTPVPTPLVTPARYRVTLDATWSAATHPAAFPPGPHFSDLIGGTHSERAVFWEPGATASPGMEAMAEVGATSPLDSEIRAAIAAGTAERLIRGGGINPSPGAVSAEFDISPDHPLVTLVAMIAPSPDWFVGVGGLSLIENGDWVAEKTIALVLYDAGTDSGRSFRSRNSDTRPQEPITRLEGFPVESGAPFGTFTFVRISS